MAMEGNEMSQRLTEDYYTLAEIRLIVDTRIDEYGDDGERLSTIRSLIDLKRPELQPSILTAIDCDTDLERRLAVSVALRQRQRQSVAGTTTKGE